MGSPFPFEDLPELAKERVVEWLDGRTVGSLRRVSRSCHSLISSRTHLLQKMQVQIHGLRDIHQIQEEMATLSSSSPLPLPIWTNFRINPPHPISDYRRGLSMEEDRLIPTFVAILGHTLRKLEVNRRINHEDLGHLLSSLPDLQVFKAPGYITGGGFRQLCNPSTNRFSLTQGQGLVHLVDLSLPATPLLGRVLSRAPNLRRLTVLSIHWGEYYATPSELTASITSTLLAYLRETFHIHMSPYPTGTRREMDKEELRLDFSPPLPFTTPQLLSICAMCRHPLSGRRMVGLDSISASSLPRPKTPLDPRVLDSLNVIHSIIVGDSDGDRIFPSNVQEGENNGKVIYCVDVGERTPLAEIDIPPTTPLTDLILRMDTHPWSLHHYMPEEMRHALTQLFVPRPYLRSLEISRLILDSQALLDNALQFELFPNLRSLSIQRFGDDPSQFRALCEGLPQLERLTLSHIRDEHLIGEEGGGLFPPILKLTKLRSLKLSESHVTKRSMGVLGRMKLDTLILEDCNNCQVHEMKMSWVDELLGVGGVGVGPLGSWVSYLELPKPRRDWREEIIVNIKRKCPFLQNLQFIPQQIRHKYHPEDEPLGPPICRLIRDSPGFPEVWWEVRDMDEAE